MATDTPSTFNHEATQRSVRHPLQLMRKYIRRYVILEGLALTILFMSLLFWLGLAIDYGLYATQFDSILDLGFVEIPVRHYGIDWVQELNDLDATGYGSIGIRVILLAVCVVALLALGITKVVVRWIREFNDRTLALVLERRFHKQLGDRLITAIELADPKLSKKYGYSQAMVEKTIQEAVDTLKRLPVSGVFNWNRLLMLWIMVGFSTVGIWLLLMAVCCVGSFFSGETLSPYGFGWRFYDAASIWGERNLAMMSSYWPRRSYLEIGRFQPSKENPLTMRIARDDAESRPELQVRAIQWVVADRAAPQGWRALTWKDLPRFVSQDLIDGVKIAANFPDWKIDPSELEPNLAAALFGSDTQPRSSGAVRQYLDTAPIQEKIRQRGAQKTLTDWLDWKNWSMDKIALQMEDPAARIGLRENESYANLEKIVAELKEVAASHSMRRTLRKLDAPERIEIAFRGEENSSTDSVTKQEGNVYNISLRELKETSRFRVRGEDYYTSPRQIELIPAPAPTSISVDKAEPAYIYQRLYGEDQTPLAGLKQISKNVPYPPSGETTILEVPLGTNVDIHVRLGATTQIVTLDDKFQAGDTFALAFKSGAVEGTTKPIVFSGSLSPEVKGTDAHLQAALTELLATYPALSGSSVSVNAGSDHGFTVNFLGAASINLEKLTPTNIVSAGGGTIKVEPLKTTKLRAEKSVFPKDSPLLEVGYLGFPFVPGAIEPHADAGGFSLHMTNVIRKHDFVIEFFDEDNIRGKRRFKIIAVIDTEPFLTNLGVHKVNLYAPKKGKDSDSRDLKDHPEIMGAFLITPDALIPFECKVSDNYGLVRAGYQYKLRTVDFELTPQGAKKTPVSDLNPASLKLQTGAIASVFQFTTATPTTLFLAPQYIGMMGLVLENDLKQSHGYEEAYVPAEGFKRLVESKAANTRKNGRWLFPSQLNDHVLMYKALHEPRSAQAWEFDFNGDVDSNLNLGFDVRKLLKKIKSSDPTRVGQLHYLLQISVQASDNNVETGSFFTNEKGQTLRGNTRKNKNGYLSFLVVSENELLLRIAQEEAPLLENLEYARDVVDGSIVRLEEQKSKFRDDKIDMDQVLNRMNEIRTSLGSVNSKLRESYMVYNNIHDVMKLNRVRKDRLEKIRDKIIYPLEYIVIDFPNDRCSFGKAEDSFMAAHQMVERDAVAKLEPDALQHAKNMTEAVKHLEKLRYDIKLVLDAMTDGIDESKTIAALVATVEQQERMTRRLEELNAKVTGDLLDELLNNPKKDKK